MWLSRRLGGCLGASGCLMGLTEGFEPFAGVEELKPVRLDEYCGPKDVRTGLAECKHSVRKTLEDEGIVTLDWHMKIDPETVLSLDTEQDVRLTACDKGQLELELPTQHAEKLKEGTLIVASHYAHTCPDSVGKHLFHKISEVTSREWVGEGASRVLRARVVSKSHKDFADVVPHISFNFSYMPVEAQDIVPYPKMRTDFGQFADRDRKLAADFDHRVNYGNGEQHSSSSLGVDNGGSLLKFSPKQISNFGFNWDFFMNSTENPEFNLSLPGLDGYIMLKQPYIKIHAGLFLNFTSHFEGIMGVPKVHWKAGILGHGVINARMITDMKSTSAVSEDAFHLFSLPQLEKFENPHWLSQMNLAAGSFPVSVEPGFQFRVEMYHKGHIDGTLQIGGRTHAVVTPITEYSSQVGIQMLVKADFQDTELYPPLWIVSTDHFEMGVQFEPTVWLRGQFGRSAYNNAASEVDERIGMELRPYMNVTLKREGLAEIGDHKRTLIAYPFRVIGLDTVRFSERYQVQIEFSGIRLNSASEMNWGEVDIHDHLDKFNFGQFEQKTVLTQSFTVSLLQVDGSGGTTTLSSGEINCDAILNGECQPMPRLVQFDINGDTISIEVAILWQENPIPWFASRIRGVDWMFPQITLNQKAMEALVPELKDGGKASQALNLRVTHASRSYTTRLNGFSSSDTTLLAGQDDFEFGPTFVDSWKPCGKPSCESAKMELFYGGRLIASSLMPEIAWGELDNIVTVTDPPVEHKNTFAEMLTGKDGFLSSMKSMEGILRETSLAFKPSQQIPLSLNLAPVDLPSDFASVAVVHAAINVIDPSRAACFLSPSKPTEIGLDSQENFIWTISNVQEDRTYTFKISPLELASAPAPTEETMTYPTVDSLILLPIDGAEEQLSATCGRHLVEGVSESDVPCSFSHLFTFDSNRYPVGTRIVLLVAWQDSGVNHLMQSAPFRVSTNPQRQLRSRRLWTAEDWNERLAANSASCEKEDLDFDLEYGTMARARVVGDGDNPLLPLLSESMARAFMSTGFQSLGENDIVDSDIKSLLPEWLCGEGVCSGKMPGCTEANFETMHFPELAYNFNRPFLFADIEEGRRQIQMMTAYAFSMLPEAVEIIIKEINDTVNEDETQAVLNNAFGALGAGNAPRSPWPQSDQAIGVAGPPPQYRWGPQYSPPATGSANAWPVFNSGPNGEPTSNTMGLWRRLQGPDANPSASGQTAATSWTGSQVSVRFPKGVPFVMDRPLLDMMLRHGMFDEVVDDHSDRGRNPLRIVDYAVFGGGDLRKRSEETESHSSSGFGARGFKASIPIVGLAAAAFFAAMVSMGALASNRRRLAGYVRPLEVEAADDGGLE